MHGLVCIVIMVDETCGKENVTSSVVELTSAAPDFIRHKILLSRGKRLPGAPRGPATRLVHMDKDEPKGQGPLSDARPTPLSPGLATISGFDTGSVQAKLADGCSRRSHRGSLSAALEGCPPAKVGVLVASAQVVLDLATAATPDTAVAVSATAAALILTGLSRRGVIFNIRDVGPDPATAVRRQRPLVPWLRGVVVLQYLSAPLGPDGCEGPKPTLSNIRFPFAVENAARNRGPVVRVLRHGRRSVSRRPVMLSAVDRIHEALIEEAASVRLNHLHRLLQREQAVGCQQFEVMRLSGVLPPGLSLRIGATTTDLRHARGPRRRSELLSRRIITVAAISAAITLVPSTHCH